MSTRLKVGDLPLYPSNRPPGHSIQALRPKGGHSEANESDSPHPTAHSRTPADPTPLLNLGSPVGQDSLREELMGGHSVDFSSSTLSQVLVLEMYLHTPTTPPGGPSIHSLLL